MGAKKLLTKFHTVQARAPQESGRRRPRRPGSLKPSFPSLKSTDCNPFHPDLRSSSLCGVEFVFKMERSEKEGAAEFRIERNTEIILLVKKALSQSLRTD